MAQPAGGPGASPPAVLGGARVLLGVTGGIAAYKAAELARELQRAGAEVQPLLTADAERMVTRATFAALTGRRVPASVWDDPGAVEHVALARWGQVLVVAPATAHTLARLAAGLADDLLTNVALAFPGPVVVAPAMHTEMWEHPATRANLATLAGRGVRVVPPASGPLTSGDVGPGRLAELDDLVAGVAAALDAPGHHPGPGRSLAGTRWTRSATSATAPRGGWGRPSWPRPWPAGPRLPPWPPPPPSTRRPGPGWSGSRPPSSCTTPSWPPPTTRTCW
jgi:phosphopantothenoylcysteine decarboxylase/phosphopantothenate--cysteine ligase